MFCTTKKIINRFVFRSFFRREKAIFALLFNTYVKLSKLSWAKWR